MDVDKLRVFFAWINRLLGVVDVVPGAEPTYGFTQRPKFIVNGFEVASTYNPNEDKWYAYIPLDDRTIIIPVDNCVLSNITASTISAVDPTKPVVARTGEVEWYLLTGVDNSCKLKGIPQYRSSVAEIEREVDSIVRQAHSYGWGSEYEVTICCTNGEPVSRTITLKEGL